MFEQAYSNKLVWELVEDQFATLKTRRELEPKLESLRFEDENEYEYEYEI